MFSKDWTDEEIALGLKMGITRAGRDMFANFKIVGKRDLYKFMCNCFPEFTEDKEWKIPRKLFYEELKDYYE